jgi:ABC-type Fe3+-hydroxamate transport system substrate-binding protein
MPRYRLDEYRFLRGKLTRNRQIWLEEIKIQPDGEIYYTENYVHTDLIKLLKNLNRPNNHFSSFGVSMFEELIEACNAMNEAITEEKAAKEILSDIQAKLSRFSQAFRDLQKNEAVKVKAPVIYPYKGEFYCIYSSDKFTFAEKAEFYKPE